jgi:hypothetical protein
MPALPDWASLVPHLRRLTFRLDVFPAIPGWAIFSGPALRASTGLYGTDLKPAVVCCRMLFKKRQKLLGVFVFFVPSHLDGFEPAFV